MARVLLFIFIFSFFYGKSIVAQNVEDIRLNEVYQERPLKDFLSTLHEKYGLSVFYKEHWIESYTITKTFQNTPLIQALNNIFLDHDLTFTIFQNNAIVIFPKVSDTRSRFVDNIQLLIIGDPLNTGRYKNAVLRGRVLDGKNSEPLVGAVVFENKLQKGATTDEKGEFKLELPTGDHQLQFSFMGFENSMVKIRLIEDGYEDFDLFEESHNIGEVTILGEESDLPRSQMSMVQMSSKEIKQMPALMGEVDILKGLTMLAGVQTVSELSSGFNVRGGNTDQNLILINGSPVFNSSHLFGFLSLINPDVVEDVRLFKGGMPVKFGERVASVMEVDFKDGNNEMIRFYGGIGIINSRLTLEGPLSKNKKLTFIAGGRSSYTNWILHQIPDVDISNSVTNFYDLSGKLTYKFNAHNSFSLMGYASNDEFSTSSQSITQYGNLLGNFHLNTRFSEALYGDLEVSHSEYAYRLTDFADDKPQEAYYLDNDLKYSSLAYDFKWHPHPRHNAEYGFKAILNEISPGIITPVEDVSLIEKRTLNNEKTVEAAAYVGDEFEVLPQFSFSAGLRFSHFSNIGTPIVYIYEENKPRIPENVIDSIRFQPNEVSKS
ncbi:MAG: carboxypeptidase-like regulatory domain-containing protein, partial [Desulfobacter sp.]|nr:carboxypeptidase-like regulatory domain-containing protein [Desulfobacter sp.]